VKGPLMPDFDAVFGVPGMQDELLKALASSSLAGTDASPLIKEDLEMEAHTQLWLETDPVELVILKHLPRQAATSVIHQYDQIIGYGPQGTTSFYGEASLPPEAAIQTRRRTETIRLQGLISSVFALASFQTPIQALGQNNLVDQNMASTRLALLRSMAVATYASDNSTTTDGIRFRGIKQQILEGTSPSTSFPFTVNPLHVIDLRGAKLSPAEIRRRARQTVERYGTMRWVYMSPESKEQLEGQLDPSERLYLTRGPAEPVIMGQNVDGMFAQGSTVHFAPDNTLTASNYGGTAPLSAVTNAPSPLTGANVAAPTAAVNALGKWVAADADAAVVYQVTALNASGESTPFSPATVAVVAGQAVTIALTPRAADTSYKIYRGGDGIHNPAVPQLIAEIRGPGNTTPFNFVDLNDKIPGTTEAFGLSVFSNNSEVLFGNRHLEEVRDRITLGNAARSRNTITLATLGPWMGIFDLAHILHQASRDLVFTAYTPVLTHPFQNVVWSNVGTR
jgi:hypothetical protein